jgi:hypothetical protein
LLEDFYFVHGIWVPAYVVEKGKMGNVLEISGTAQNVRIAAYVHDFIRHFIDSQWTEYNQQKRLNQHRKTDFALGIIEGFRSKMQTRNPSGKKPGSTQALVKKEDPYLSDYVKYRYRRIVKSSLQPSRHDAQVVRAGRSRGKKLVVYRGVTERSTTESKGRSIPPPSGLPKQA